MKLYFIILLFYVPVVGHTQNINYDSLNSRQNRKINAIIGKPYHKISLVDGDKEISNADFENKVVFINFWHSLCSPCIAEIEALNKLYDSFKANPKFKFISLTFESSEKINEMKAKYNIKFPVFSINEYKCDRLMYNFAFPLNVVLSNSGIVKYISPGASLDKQKNIDNFQKKIFPIINVELGESIIQN